METVGPLSDQSYLLPKSLLKHQQACLDYIGDLSEFDRFCIWRYTIGSGSINMYLIFKSLPDNGPYWVQQFLEYYNNTYEASVGKKLLPSSWKFLSKYIGDINTFKRLPKKQKDGLSLQVIKKYADTLQRIIMKSPSITGKGFPVLKIASKYPGLPEDTSNFKRARVEQLPFNSVTFDLHLNLAPFMSPIEGGSVLFDIFLPKGSKALYVPASLHAYPFENELILPFGCTFNIKSYSKVIMNYIDTNDVNIVLLQPRNNITMGNVYGIQPYNNCVGGRCRISKKTFTMFDTTYQNPNP